MRKELTASRTTNSEVNVLDDDVGDVVDETNTLAPDDTLLTDTDNGLVALDVDRDSWCNVVCDLNGRQVGAAPIRTVEGILTARTTCVAVGNLFSRKRVSLSL